ncbi:ABC transporter ATP-binding protein [Cellulomonas sp. ES6]|uniref:ABC transporter ATP-binding protein n=1 Tax=Cellulomonas sp. ES6 TaxID=3039384 RepID=UPI00198865EF|nr:ABC transporter ATP-binding protein [Cellulomonas sp. ES6]MBD3779803.1 ABC transporter ATP-binding protein [Micrococcales bacterium]WHP17189.1 ABC transporter ATP-binding protein [Cellulomonas sp. ES6]
MTTVIEIRDVSKRFVIRKEKSLKERVVNFGRSNLHKEDFWALRDVDLEIASGSTVGLIGPNGSGKSTLLKTIGGIIQPTTGTVRLRGRLAALLELGAGFHPDLTGRENVYLNASILGLSKAETDRHFDAIVDFSGIEEFIDTQVKFYSSGMYVRLAFAVAVHVDPDILLVDEVLAVGDEPFQRKCLERIRSFQHDGRTIIMVTHSLDQVAEFCDRAVVLEHGNVAADGTPREALKVLRQEFETTRQEEVERAQAAQGLVLPAVRVTGVNLRTPEGVAPLPPVPTGEGMVVEVEVTADTLLRNWDLSVGITSPLGTVLSTTSAKMMKAPLPDLQGKGNYAFRMGRLPFGEGEYIIQVRVVGPDGTSLDHVPDAAHFSVEADGTSQGPVHVPVSFAAAG